MDKREEHLQKTSQAEAKTEKKLNSELKPYPNGKQFRALFSKFLDVKNLPYMSSMSLNKDIILYRAMIIAQAVLIGQTKQKDSKNAVAMEKFLSSEAMKDLGRNEFASNYHENDARKKCYNTIKGEIQHD